MSQERECAKTMKAIIGAKQYDTFVAKVIKVDGATCEVERVIDNKKLDNVRLNVSSTEEQGTVITPKLDSNVLITTIDGYQWFVSQFSEIEKITVDAEDTIIINGGENRGLVKVEKMTEWMQKVYNDLDTLKTSLNTWAVAGNGAPLGLVFNPTTPNPQVSNFENEKIKH